MITSIKYNFRECPCVVGTTKKNNWNTMSGTSSINMPQNLIEIQKSQVLPPELLNQTLHFKKDLQVTNMHIKA